MGKFHLHLEQIEIEASDRNKNPDREEQISQIKKSCHRREADPNEQRAEKRGLEPLF